jgi:hypothetical protein
MWQRGAFIYSLSLALGRFNLRDWTVVLTLVCVAGLDGGWRLRDALIFSQAGTKYGPPVAHSGLGATEDQEAANSQSFVIKFEMGECCQFLHFEFKINI